MPDYSRHDLNGDGFTGGSRAAGFDLDPTGSEQFGARSLGQVTAEVGGEERSFDEAFVTDADVLCFYGPAGTSRLTRLYPTPERKYRAAPRAATLTAKERG